MRKTTFALGVSIMAALFCLCLTASLASAVELFFSFDGTLNNTGATTEVLVGGTPTPITLGINGTTPASLYTAGTGRFTGRDVLNFDKSFYLDTNTNISGLNLDGNSARSYTFWAKIDSDNTSGGLFHTGTNVNAGGSSYDFSLRCYDWQTAANADVLRIQMWGGDLDFKYSDYSDWTMYTVTYDGTYVSTFVNGQQIARGARSLNTADSPLRIGTYFDGGFRNVAAQMADFSASDAATSARAAWRNYHNALGHDQTGFFFSFAEVPSVLDGKEGWLVGCGNSAIRTGNQNAPPDGAELTTYLNPKPADCNNQAGTGDQTMGMVWGPVFTVLDGDGVITAKISSFGGPLDLTKRVGGGAGVALYNVTDGKLIESSFIHGTGNGVWSTQDMHLTGLEGKTLTLVAIDRETGGYGWVAIDTVYANPGSVQLHDFEKTHKVTLEYTFDTGWDGWFETDLNGVRQNEITNFGFGKNPDGGFIGYIDSTLEFKPGESGCIASSDVRDGGRDWDVPTGILRSENFIIDGNVLEFMLVGGMNSEEHFDLLIDLLGDGNYTVAQTAVSQHNDRTFRYDFWSLEEDWQGMSAYLRLYDGADANWGWIGVDNIRMLNFTTLENGQSPEPATWIMLIMGAAGLMACYRRRIAKP